MYSEEQKSQHIYDLQTCLRRLQQERGVSPLVPDGIYGAETAEAVRAHQRECGLPVTGRVDRETWDSIYAAAAQLFAADTPPAAVLFFPRSGVLAPGSRGRAVFVLQLILATAAPHYANTAPVPLTGEYDPETAAAVRLMQGVFILPQTGGGCRASNYIHLLRKALVKAGYPQIPVASLNFSGLEKDSGFQMTLPLARRALACIFYGDMLCALRNQVAPYENEKGAADKMVDLWVERLGRVLLAGKGYTSKEMKHTFPLIAKDFAAIPVTRVPKVKVGVVGEIYVKYSPLGNNDLQKFLESQDCEVNFPGLMGFVQYCAFNMGEDHVLYGGKLAVKVGTDQFLNWLDSVERVMLKAETDAGFYAPGPFKELVEKPKGVISLGAKMGEGWLLTAEMIELVQGGYGNIVCAQPFGCLPNHIVGKGMVNKIRALYPASNITPIDYDPSATKVNQENRIKLMLAVAKERLNNPVQEPVKPLTAEELAGGAPRLSHETANV